jgi:ferrous iron transport protein B
MTPKQIHIALVGNPNAGKSTIFNALTGENQRVGNWPGKTIEHKEGWFTLHDQQISLIDLPGAYSLTAYSQEEIITRDYLLQNHPDLVINVLDAANLERNLYLTVQLLEMGLPTIAVLNMTDITDRRGWHVDEAKLQTTLGIPVVKMAARQGKGLDALKQQILTEAAKVTAS